MSILAALTLHGPRTLDGTHLIALERTEAWTDEEVAAAQAVVEVWVEAGHRGAFPMPGADPAISDLTLSAPTQTNEAYLGFTVDATSVDPRSLQLLRHMLSRLGPPDDASLRHIAVTAQGHSMGARLSFPAIDGDNEHDQYPPAPTQPGFGVYWDDDIGYSRARRVLVEFPGAVEGPPVDTLADYALVWGAMVEGGAFTLPQGLPDVLDNVMGSVSQFDIATLEIEVPVFKSNERAFDLLFHLLARYHTQEQPIRLVTVE